MSSYTNAKQFLQEYFYTEGIKCFFRSRYTEQTIWLFCKTSVILSYMCTIGMYVLKLFLNPNWNGVSISRFIWNSLSTDIFQYIDACLLTNIDFFSSKRLARPKRPWCISGDPMNTLIMILRFCAYIWSGYCSWKLGNFIIYEWAGTNFRPLW